MPPKRSRSRSPFGAGPGPAPGGVSAGASAAAAAPAPGSSSTRIFGPRGSPSGRLSRGSHNAALFANPSSLHYASLMDAGLVADPEESASIARGGAAAPHAHETMMAAYRRLLPYNGTKHSSALVLHGASMVGDSNGLSAAEAEAYMGDGDGPMADALYEAAMTAIGHAYVPSTLRIDTTYSTRIAHADRDTADIAQALLGGRLVDVPRLHAGEREPTSSPDTLRSAIKSYVQALGKHIEDMPDRASNRTLHALISSNVWLTPSLSSAHGGTRRLFPPPKRSFAGTDEHVEYSEEGVAFLPASFLQNRGIVINAQDTAWNGRCIALALLRGLDDCLESSSDSNLINILRQALQGATNVLHQKQRALAGCTADPASALRRRRMAEMSAAEERVAERSAELDEMTARFLAAGRTVRFDDSPPQRFHATARASAVEAAALQAFWGKHPLINLRHPRYRSPQHVNAETVAAIRADLKPTVKVQFWTVGMACRLRLAFPDPTATLSWLRESPQHRLLNVLFAHQHVAWVRSVGMACSHYPVYADADAEAVVHEHKSDDDVCESEAEEGDEPEPTPTSTKPNGRKGRHIPKGGFKVYCPLCGASKARGKGRAHWLVYEHQHEGCAKGGGVSTLAPLSPQNIRQLSFAGYKALNRPMALAVLAAPPAEPTLDGRIPEAAAALGIWFLTPSGYAPLALQSGSMTELSTPQSLNRLAWNRWWRDNNYTFSRDSSVAIPAAEPFVVVRSATAVYRPMQQVLEKLTSVPFIDMLWTGLHFVGPRNPAALSALMDVSKTGEGALCYACRLPVTEPSTWARQQALRHESEATGAGAAAPHAEDEDEDGHDDSSSEADAEEEEGGEDVEMVMEPPAPAANAAWRPVLHHCHATGAVAWAHADCNTLMRQSTSELVIDVESVVAMAAAIDVLFRHDFWSVNHHRMENKPPKILRSKDGDIRSVHFTVRGTDRTLHPREMTARKDRALAAGLKAPTATHAPKRLRIVLRAMDALLPEGRRVPIALAAEGLPAGDASEAAFIKAKVLCDAAQAALVDFNETAFRKTRLWPGAFATAITYSRNALLASLPPGDFCTSIASMQTLRDVGRLTKGGAIVIGCAPEMLPLADPLDRRTVRVYLDINSNYPVQMTRRRFPLPMKEHDDRVLADFTTHPEAGIAYLSNPNPINMAARLRNLRSDMCQRVELWGTWPLAAQQKLRQFPPNFEPIDVAPSELSSWQRKACGIPFGGAPLQVSAGHFRPVEGRVLFLRTALLWLRLGFQLTKVGKVWGTPASYWAADFAEGLERRRRDAALTKLDVRASPATKAAAALEEEDVKLIANSVIGSLNQDASKFATLRTVYEPMARTSEGTGGSASVCSSSSSASARLSRTERLSSDPSFTGRIMAAGDCELFEHGRLHWRHTQQTLAALFIQEMARCDHLEMFYGDLEGKCVGIQGAFPSAKVGYGNTDSLVVEISVAAGDARSHLYQALGTKLDISNIPLTSSFYSAMSLTQRAAAHLGRLVHAGEWGCYKLEDAGAGVNHVVVNGPNRWGFSVVQSPTDTLDKHRGAGACVLKSVPKAWRGVVTLAQFAADLHFKHAAHTLADDAAGIERPADLRIAPEPVDRFGADVGTVVRAARGARRAALWGNKACCVAVVATGLPERERTLIHEPFGLAAELKMYEVEDEVEEQGEGE